MKKPFLHIAFFLFFTILVFQGANAQSYVISPDKTYSIDLRKNEFNDYHIWIINKKDQPLTIHWQLLHNSFSQNAYWRDNNSYSLCDNIVCYLTIPQMADMKPVAPGDSAFFKLSFDPAGQEDTASMQLIINDIATPDKIDTVTYIVNTLHLGVKAYEAAKNVKLYPNPATNFINVDFSASSLKPVSVSIFNVLGQRIMDVPVSTSNLINISTLPVGSYSICILDKNGKMAWKQFCKSSQ